MEQETARPAEHTVEVEILFPMSDEVARIRWMDDLADAIAAEAALDGHPLKFKWASLNTRAGSAYHSRGSDVLGDFEAHNEAIQSYTQQWTGRSAELMVSSFFLLPNVATVKVTSQSRATARGLASLTESIPQTLASMEGADSLGADGQSPERTWLDRARDHLVELVFAVAAIVLGGIILAVLNL